MDENIPQQNIPNSTPKKESFWHRHLLAELLSIFLVAATIGVIYYIFSGVPRPEIKSIMHKAQIDASSWKTYKNDDYGFSASTPGGVNYDYTNGHFTISIFPTSSSDFNHTLVISPIADHSFSPSDQKDGESVTIGGKKFIKMETKLGIETKVDFSLADELEKWITCGPNAITCGGISYLAANDSQKQEFEKVLSSIQYYKPTTQQINQNVYFQKNDTIYVYHPTTAKLETIVSGINVNSNVIKDENYLFYTRGNDDISFYSYNLSSQQEVPVFQAREENGIKSVYTNSIFSPDKKYLAINYRSGSQQQLECEKVCDLKDGIEIYDLANKTQVNNILLPFQGGAIHWVNDNLFVIHYVYEGPTDFTVVKTNGTVTNFTGSTEGIFSPNNKYYLEIGNSGGYQYTTKNATVIDPVKLTSREILNEGHDIAFKDWVDGSTFEYIQFKQTDNYADADVYSYNIIKGAKKFIQKYIPDDGILRVDSSAAAKVIFSQSEKKYYLFVNDKIIASGDMIQLVNEDTQE